jgi:pimeloyl-ACP methyl ester carboxylesterase
MDLPIKGDLAVKAVFEDERGQVVRVNSCLESSQMGVQSLFWDNRRGHAIVNAFQSRSNEYIDLVVIRNLGAPIKSIRGAWLSGWLGERPEHFGIKDYQSVTLQNQTVAWQLEADLSKWVIHVHGRKASKGETLRNLEQFQSLGFSQLVISHESDPIPDGVGTRYSDLGATEWKQVEEAVEHALGRGAQNVVLFGWSLGAMFIGQYLLNGKHLEKVCGAIFDSPLLDYESTLRLQAENAGLNQNFGSYLIHKLKYSRVLEILGLRRKTIPSLLFDLHKPLLVFYSSTDGYVSMSKIQDFLRLNPLAAGVEVEGARHCRLLNKDPDLYKSNIGEFIDSLGL